MEKILELLESLNEGELQTSMKLDRILFMSFIATMMEEYAFQHKLDVLEMFDELNECAILVNKQYGKYRMNDDELK